MNHPNAWKEEEVRYLLDHYRTQTYAMIGQHLKRSRQAIAAYANKRGLQRTREERNHLNRTFNTGLIPKGNKPWNTGMKGLDLGGAKTWFKKGNLPHNTKPDSIASIRSSYGREYWYMRIGINQWRPVHIIRWEEHHGAVPKGRFLRCLDGNTLNTAPANWHPVTRAENARLNSNREKQAGTMKKLWAKVKLREAYGRPVHFTKLRSKHKKTFTKGINLEPAKNINF